MDNKLQGFLPLGILCFVAFFVMIAFFSASMEFCGYGVDSSGKLYVGRLYQIEVYDKGMLLRTIHVPAERAWNVTVDDSDNIVVSASGYIYLLDTVGNVTDKQIDIDLKTFLRVNKIRNIVDPDGNTYQLKYTMICPTIFKNGNVIYRAPFVDLLARVFFAMGCICFPVGIVACKTRE